MLITAAVEFDPVREDPRFKASAWNAWDWDISRLSAEPSTGVQIPTIQREGSRTQSTGWRSGSSGRVLPRSASAPGVEVLRGAAQGRRPPRGRVVGRAPAARNPAGAVRDRDGRAGRGGAARRRARRPAGRRRRRLRPAAGADADSHGHQPQPGRSHGGIPLRPADGGVRPAAGHGPSRRPGAHRRPHRRARLRSRHDRPAAVVLDGLHRRTAWSAWSAASPPALVLFGFAWWAPLVLGGAWLATHWLLRESAVWQDRNTDEVRSAQRDADYAYRLAVDPPASKELRLFGLVGLDDRALRRAAHAAAPAPVRGDAAARAAAALEPADRHRRQRRRALVAGVGAAADGRIGLGEIVVYAQCAVGTSAIAFGGLNWALDGASAPVAAVLAPGAGDGRQRAALAVRATRSRPACRRARSASATSTFAYPGGATGPRRLRPHHSRRFVARDRRAERRRQDDAGQAAVPAVRPAGRRDRDRRHRPARSRSARRGDRV